MNIEYIEVGGGAIIFALMMTGIVFGIKKLFLFLVRRLRRGAT